MQEEITLKQAASANMTRDHRVSSYVFNMGKKEIDFEVLDDEDHSIMRVQWCGASVDSLDFSIQTIMQMLQSPPKPTREGNLSMIIENKDGKLEICCNPTESGLQDTKLSIRLDGIEKSDDFLLKGHGKTFLDKMNEYILDCFVQILEQAKTTRAPTNREQDFVMSGICALAWRFVWYWPYGTAIAGPTLGGCLIYGGWKYAHPISPP